METHTPFSLKNTGKWYITEDNLKNYLSGDYPLPVK